MHDRNPPRGGGLCVIEHQLSGAVEHANSADAVEQHQWIDRFAYRVLTGGRRLQLNLSLSDTKKG